MNILLKPILTTKSINLIKSFNIYSFVVDLEVNKIQIKKEIEDNYKVNVKDIRTIICVKKNKKNYKIRKNTMKKFNNKKKKALIKIKKGQHIYI